MATNGKTAIVPPQNLDAEESVLGAMMVSESTIEPVLLDVRLHAEDFYRDRHRTIYEAIIRLNENADPVDVLTVSEALAQHGQLDEVGGRDVVASLAAKVPAPGSARYYAQIVKQNSLMRRLDGAAKRIQQSVAERDGEPSELVEHAERLLFQVAHEERAVDFREIGEILHDEIDKLEALASGTSEITGTPSGFRDLDDRTGGFQPGNLIVIAARPAMGKCQGGGTLVYDASTGARRRLDEVVASHESGEEIWIAALGSDLKIRPARISRAIHSGKQVLFRLTTRLGRSIEATANHPLLTLKGWKALEDLTVGSRIGVPRWLPRMAPASEMEDHELVLLAALIADGSIIRGTPMYCFGRDRTPLVEKVRVATIDAGASFNVGSEGRYAYLSSACSGEANPVTELCRRHGVYGKRSEDKFIPDAIFELPDHQIARFLSVLFGCDGHAYCSERLAQIGYTTISERLARDVQHLLLRFGISSCIRILKRDVYEGTEKVAREVRITDQRSLARFAMTIRIPGKEDKLGEVMERFVTASSETNVDTAPVEVWGKVLAAKGDRSWAEVSEAAGYPRNHNWHVGKRGLSRLRLVQMADVLEAPELEELADSDIWWDEVASIEEVGEEETYDLSVPTHHNFVADDVIVHNSTLVCDFAQNVTLKHQKPVALFSLEMSEMELAHRFIGSQSRISSDRLRKGKVSTKDWPKVVKACNQLESAPLWIDDSSDLGLLELRAKARRLHAQERTRGHEGLGMVMVDYLQLMRSDNARANRVEQVGQFSRGLKILARELGVPVIGVSQLSRAPEQRPDKRPILSDLRESGCLAGDSRVYLPNEGRHAPISDLVGRSGFEVLALDPETWLLEPRKVERAFSTGRKRIFRLTTKLGRIVRATANHKFLAFDGWRRIDELNVGDHLAVPRELPGPSEETMSEEELALLGLLIGDGCTLPRHAIQFTCRDRQMAEIAVTLATRVFAERIEPRIKAERSWHQVYLSASYRLTHGVRNPVAEWLEDLGAFGLRSHEKRIPERVYTQSRERIAMFLRHLWATDGCIWTRPSSGHATVYYATTSPRLATGVQDLLLRLGINARVRRHAEKHGRPGYHVVITGAPDQLEFVRVVGGLGEQRERASNQLAELLIGRGSNTNRDLIPSSAWVSIVEPARVEAGLTQRGMQAGLQVSYCGSALRKSGISRARASEVATVVRSRELMQLATSDVYWDQIVSIEDDGEEEIYDLTVEGLHNFVANNIVVHNSIEQDADVVGFLYRDDYYNAESEDPGGAELILAKHRNGPVGTVRLVFLEHYPKFADRAREERPVEQPAGEGPPIEDLPDAEEL